MDDFGPSGDGSTVILVGVDGSPTSMRAGDYATGLARRQGAGLAFLYVARLRPHLSQVASEEVDALRPRQQHAVRAQLEAGVRNAGIEALFRVVCGDPFTELCRIAEEISADAVVVGASTKVGRFSNSMPVKLVRAGRWPVTVVP